MFELQNDWNEVLSEVLSTNKMKELEEFLKEQYKNNVIYPLKDDIFTALNLTHYKDVKVVIIGQDPYHEPNQAHGLAS